MAVRLVPLVCPSCGGRIQVPEGTKSCYCMYCGTQIAIDDGSIHLHTYDEAAIKRVELENQERLAELAALERYEKRHRVWVFCIVGWVVLVGIFMVLTTLIPEGNVNQAVTLVAGCILFFGPVVLFIARPRHPRRMRRR